MDIEQQARPAEELRTEPDPQAGNGRCANCGTPIDSRFCGECGQSRDDRLVSIRKIVADVLEDQLSLDGRFPKSTGGLFRPGFLTREFGEGRIARYIHPFRLYLLFSLTFFLIFSFATDIDQVWNKVERDMGLAVDGEEAAAPAVAATGAGLAGDEAGGEQPVEVPFPTVRFQSDTITPGLTLPLRLRLARQETKLNAMTPRESLRLLIEASIRNVPPIIFLLVPGFALLLKMLYPQRLYVEHTVFILHLHAFGFLLATPFVIASSQRVGGGVIAGATAGAVMVLWMLVYLFLALRRVYGQSRLRTSFKYVALLFSYQFALVMLTLVVMAVTVLTV